MRAEQCCIRCRGALQICRWRLCDCHLRGEEKNLSYETRTYRNPTQDAAIRNVMNRGKRR